MRIISTLMMVASIGIFVSCDDSKDEIYPDADGDGYPAAEDCDDLSAGVSPGAEERCNGLDDDCDGETDEEGAEGAVQRYLDQDGDGIGGGEPLLRCPGEEGSTLQGGDCDDLDAEISPLAPERCDGVDNDCDGLADEPGTEDGELWPVDADGDGYGHPTVTGLACGPGQGFAEEATDCDDGDPQRNPGAAEVCANGQDDDCDGVADEADDAVAPTWYLDGDGDGYGGASETLQQCEAPEGYAPLANDCDDTNAEVYPGAADEDNDDLDNDCDGEIDERGDMVGEGTLVYEVDGRRNQDCKLVWQAEWVEIYPPPVGDYAWRAVQTYDASASQNAEDCEHALRGEDFTWIAALFWDSFGYEPQTLWVRREGETLWVPLFGASLRREHDELLFSAGSTTDEDLPATLSGDIDFIGL